MSYVVSDSFELRLGAYTHAQWLSVPNLMNFTQTMSNYNVTYAIDLRSAWDETAKLPWETPVGVDVRFPSGTHYVCLLAGDWTNKFSTLRASMMSIARILNVDLGRNTGGGTPPRGNAGGDHGLGDQARADLANASLSYTQTLKAMIGQVFRHEGVFNRRTFEAEMGLHWSPNRRIIGGASWEDIVNYVGLPDDALWVGNNDARLVAEAWPGLANTTVVRDTVLNVPQGRFSLWAAKTAPGRARIVVSHLNGILEMSSISAQPAND